MFISQRLTLSEQSLYLARLIKAGYKLQSYEPIGSSGKVLLYKNGDKIAKVRIMQNGWTTILA